MMSAKEFDMRGNQRNTMNGQQVKCKIVTDSREKAFQIFRNIFPSCNPCFCMAEREVARVDWIYEDMGVDVWDANRDALTFPGGRPVVAHPN